MEQQYMKLHDVVRILISDVTIKVTEADLKKIVDEVIDQASESTCKSIQRAIKAELAWRAKPHNYGLLRSWTYR